MGQLRQAAFAPPGSRFWESAPPGVAALLNIRDGVHSFDWRAYLAAPGTLGPFVLPHAEAK